MHDISRSVLLRINNVSDKICRENQNTQVRFSNFFFSENLVVCEIMWKNMLQPDGPQMTVIRRRRTTCRITKATDMHSEYVIRVAFPLQQWSHERASVSFYTCIACLFFLGGGSYIQYSSSKQRSEISLYSIGSPCILFKYIR